MRCWLAPPACPKGSKKPCWVTATQLLGTAKRGARASPAQRVPDEARQVQCSLLLLFFQNPCIHTSGLEHKCCPFRGSFGLQAPHSIRETSKSLSSLAEFQCRRFLLFLNVCLTSLERMGLLNPPSVLALYKNPMLWFGF